MKVELAALAGAERGGRGGGGKQTETKAELALVLGSRT